MSYTGFTETTPEKLLLDAGAFFKILKSEQIHSTLRSLVGNFLAPPRAAVLFLQFLQSGRSKLMESKAGRKG